MARQEQVTVAVLSGSFVDALGVSRPIEPALVPGVLFTAPEGARGVRSVQGVVTVGG